MKSIDNPSSDLQKMSKKQFEDLFCIYYNQLAAYATVILDNKSEGEDIAQEVFTYIWEKRNKINVGSNFQSYLFRTTYSRCIDHINKNNRFEKYTRDVLVKFADEYNTYLENDCNTLKELFHKDFDENINSLLAQLPEMRRKVFEMVYHDGYKADEVAEILKMPKRTIESHIYLSMKFLRKHLSPTDFIILALIFVKIT